MNLSTVKWAQWDKTQSWELLGLFICVSITLCTIVAHNIAQNRPDNFPSFPPDNHHCSDDVYLREGGFWETRGSGFLEGVPVTQQTVSSIEWISQHWSQPQKNHPPALSYLHPPSDATPSTDTTAKKSRNHLQNWRLIDWVRFNVPLNTSWVISGTGFTGQMTQPTVSKHWRK